MTDTAEQRDLAMRRKAFDHVRSLVAVHGTLTRHELEPGFLFEGERIPLLNPQRGIFKPKQMRFLLSIRTVFPRRGARVWYDDQRDVHEQINRGDEAVEYAFQGVNPDAHDNRWLREAWEHRIPIIYFVGVAPGQAMPVVPAYIAGWNPDSLKALVGFGDPVQQQDERRFPDAPAARRYALHAVRQRLHQATFRQAVIAAYDGRCAISNLPEPMLLDAAHIIADRNEQFGQPVVPNGIPLTKLHHAAFDAHLIGIDADFRLHVSERLLAQNDGPVLEALKQLQGKSIRLPERIRDRPDRARLAMRFEHYQHAR
jgi:putative restriction endonuclease